MPETTTPTVPEQYAADRGTQVAHRAWTEACKGIGRQASEELRLFPNLKDEDKTMYAAIATAVAADYDDFSGTPVKVAAAVLLDSAETHDENRMLVSKEALRLLAVALERPLDVGKDRVTIQTLDGGNFLAQMNAELARGVALLEAGGDRGEIKMKSTAKLKRDGFIYAVSTDVELTGGKQEKTQLFVRGKVEGGSLVPYDAKAEAAAIKAEQEKPKKTRKPKAVKEEAPAEFTPPTAGDQPEEFLPVGSTVKVSLGEGRTTKGKLGERHEGGRYWVTTPDGDQLFDRANIKPWPPQPAEPIAS